jgi:hypothetical protein
MYNALEASEHLRLISSVDYGDFINFISKYKLRYGRSGRMKGIYNYNYLLRTPRVIHRMQNRPKQFVKTGTY